MLYHDHVMSNNPSDRCIQICEFIGALGFKVLKTGVTPFAGFVPLGKSAHLFALFKRQPKLEISERNGGNHQKNNLDTS